MCQAKRPGLLKTNPMNSPADEITQALALVDHIAQEVYEAERRQPNTSRLPWGAMNRTVHDAYRAVVIDLLERDVIRVGKRPQIERPLEGQTTIDEQLA